MPTLLQEAPARRAPSVSVRPLPRGRSCPCSFSRPVRTPKVRLSTLVRVSVHTILASVIGFFQMQRHEKQSGDEARELPPCIARCPAPSGYARSERICRLHTAFRKSRTRAPARSKPQQRIRIQTENPHDCSAAVSTGVRPRPTLHIPRGSVAQRSLASCCNQMHRWCKSAARDRGGLTCSFDLR